MFTSGPSKQRLSEAFEVQEHFSPLCSGPLVFEQGSCLVPDAKGPRPWESRPGSISLPCSCPLPLHGVWGRPPPGSTLGAPERVVSYPGRAALLRTNKRGGPTQKGGILALWAPSVCQMSGCCLHSSLRQACPAPPLHRQGKLRPAKTPGVAHVHQAEE